MEKLRQVHDSQHATIFELNCQLSRRAELEVAQETQLQEVRVQMEALQAERLSLVSEIRKMGAENSDLRARYKVQEEMLTALVEQVERLA